MTKQEFIEKWGYVMDMDYDLRQELEKDLNSLIETEKSVNNNITYHTALWWFERAPEEYRKILIEGYEKYDDKKDRIYDSIKEALNESFIWGDTDEKHEYWYKIYNNL